jgi:hypothetical protein
MKGFNQNAAKSTHWLEILSRLEDTEHLGRMRGLRRGEMMQAFAILT